MSKQVVANYVFNTGAKTITLSDFSVGQPVLLERLALITDTTTNKILYNFADSTLTTASVSGNNVITLAALQGGEANGDKLRIDYDTRAGDPEYSAAATISPGNLALDATLTSGSQQTKITDGTNTVHILKADGTAAGQNSQMIAGTHLTVPFSTASVQAVAVTDAANYAWVSIHITSQGTSSNVAFQCSNDNVNWSAMAVQVGSATISGGFTSTSNVLFAHGALLGRYFRLNITGISAGTTAGTIEFFTQPKGQLSTGTAAAQSGTWTVQPGNTANTTAWKVDGSAVTQPANTAQIAGTATSVNAGGNDAGTQRVAQAVAPTIYNGKKAVTTAGTRVALAASQALTQGVTVKALVANTGTIYLGDASVSSTTGFALIASETVTLPIANLATVFLDSSVSGEGVTYIGV